MIKKQTLSKTYQALSFPLNVYARLLQLDNKPVDYLHFGLFQYVGEDVYTAQQHSTEKVIQHLPDPPGHILEIGMGLGTLQKILLDKGYQAQGLTPDQAQCTIASQTIGSQAHIHCTRFEDFHTEQRFSAIITQESAQYIDSLQLLPKIMSLLEPKGRLILIDEVCLNAQEIGYEALHNPSHLKFLAQSLGLTLQYEEDLSEYAQYTMEYLLAQLNQHHNDILSLIDGNIDQLNALTHDIKRYIDHYQKKIYGYQLMVFVKEKESNHSISYLTEQQFPDFQPLFQAAFGQSMTMPLWQWKYQSSVSPSYSIAYWQESHLVAHYGGFERPILFFGTPHKALQMGDTMVAPNKRGIMTKNGLFSQLARVFLHRFIGYGSAHLLGFGFPNARVMKLAETLKLYQPAGRMTRLSWSHSSLKAHLKPRVWYKIRPISMQEDRLAINTLWKKMANDTQHFIIGIRDGQRIDYRYVQHPEKNYSVLKVQQRLSNQLLAVLVLSKEDSQYQLLDFICSIKHIPIVLYAAIRFSQQEQTSLYTHISDNLKPYFKAYPYAENDPQITIPHSCCTAGPDIEQVRDKWWLMGGDSDFM